MKTRIIGALALISTFVSAVFGQAVSTSPESAGAPPPDFTGIFLLLAVLVVLAVWGLRKLLK